MKHTAHNRFWPGHRGPLNTQHRPNVSIREMASWHPGSVYNSLIENANWLEKLNISTTAKRLSRLSGRQFQLAVERILTGDQRPRKATKIAVLQA